MSFNVYRYRIELECTGSIHFNSFPGVYFRGGFGKSLYGLTCTHQERPTCAGCPEEMRCPYPFVFRPRAALLDLDHKRYRHLPRPFVLRPRAGAGTYAAGAVLTLDLTLVGTAQRRLPFVLQAIRQLGEEGVGVKSTASKSDGTFRLISAYTVGPEREVRIYDDESDMLEAVDVRWRFPEDFLSEHSSGPATSEFKLDFETPTRLDKKDRLDRAPEFARVVRALLSRLSILSRAYDAGPPVIGKSAYLSLKEAARGITVRSHSCVWIQSHHRSRRHKRAVPLAGWQGDVTYAGDVTPWLPWLRIAPLVHVGRWTTYGFGRVRLMQE